jgi:hypothetical protein
MLLSLGVRNWCNGWLSLLSRFEDWFSRDEGYDVIPASYWPWLMESHDMLIAALTPVGVDPDVILTSLRVNRRLCM